MQLLDASTVSKPFVTTAHRAWLRIIALHGERDTHATQLFAISTHPMVISDRLGHASIQITLDLYSHVAPEIQEAAAAPFDRAFTLMHNGARNEGDTHLIDNILPGVDYVTFH